MKPPDAATEPTDLFPAPALPIAALDDTSRLACLRLIRSENVGPVTFRELINHFGGAQSALDALPELSRRAGRGKPLKLFAEGLAERELEAATKACSVPIFTIEPGYPTALAQLDHPPPMIYARGNPSLLANDMVAIVGSRLASAAGIKLTRQFAAELGQARLVIASGLARGIDGAAHEMALPTGTVAVVAGGVDIVYPPEHAKLYGEITERGCIITEMPPGYQPRAQDFPRRNRIISGISLGVVIIEAAKRSGTLVTARYAAEQGREVFAVPGHPLDPRAEGTNRLIKNGATLTTCTADILDVLGPITGRHPVQLAEPAATFAAPPPLPPPRLTDSDLDQVIASLGPAPVDIDTIVRATGLPIRAVHIALMELDLAGRIERHGSQLVSLRL
ncbi:MAG: DNA-processing protein DprA [Hyphomicrobiaceae bacterium]